MDLESNLKIATFNASGYFLELEEGCYIVSDNIFKDVIEHPSLVGYYKTFKVLESFGLTKGKEPDTYFTIFKSISKNHLEFMNGAILVKNVKEKL
jgi:hypothetical protein